MRRQNNNHPKEQIERACFFCVKNLKKVDYKNTPLFQRSISNYARILPGKRTGTCSKHQRKVAQAIKRARHMALIPFTNQ